MQATFCPNWSELGPNSAINLAFSDRKRYALFKFEQEKGRGISVRMEEKARQIGYRAV
jgi:hypothetical protein